MDQEISREKGLEVGTVRVGAFPVASAHFLPKIISIIAAKYPQLDFVLYEGTILEIKEWLEARVIDVGLIIPPDDEFETITLYREKMYAVIRDDHPMHNRFFISVKDLSSEPLISCKSGYEQPVVDLFNRAETDLRVRYVVKYVNTALNMVQEGLGTAIMSQLSLGVLPPNVVIRELEPEAYRDIRLAVPSLEEASIAVKLFIRTALELFNPSNAAGKRAVSDLSSSGRPTCQ